jgi:hypothetical protein
MTPTALFIGTCSLNIHKNFSCLDLFLNDKFANLYSDILFIQELPQAIQHGTIPDGLSAEGTPLFGFPKCQGWTFFHHPISSSDHTPQVVTYIWNHTNPIHFLYCPDIIDHPDVVVISCHLDDSITWLVNMYNTSPNPNNSAIQLLMDSNINFMLDNMFIGGDFKLHHDLWHLLSDPQRSFSSASTKLAEWIEALGLVVLNNRDIPTFVSSASKSIIDLGLTNSPEAITNFCTHSDHSLLLFSDHSVVLQCPLHLE